ncbi:MAG: helix-turn-helix domain-containing protein [Candidatus Omnitrophica bacterium]|nr:helix-turn-helix domain-containing protein [Candidatus Omnitrophota bacterium]
MIEELCKKIKEKRKSAGYSIEEVVRETKLHPSVIRDIEGCNLGNITPIYIKGFVKIYASFLGIEVKDELEEIKGKVSSQIKRPKRKKDLSQSPIFKIFKLITKKITKIPPRTRKKIVTVAVVLIILWLGFLGIRFSFRKVLAFFRNKPKAEQLAPEKALEAEEALGQTQADKPKSMNIGQLDQITASLTVKEDCYIRAISDGKVIFEGVLDKGEVETWRADKELEFKISDASAVYLEVDGESIPKLSSIHKPIKSLIINSSGITVNK